MLKRASRILSNEGTKRIQVQLLKDHPALGVKGQLVLVKPGFMRQQLHPQKYAAYTVKGPRIPVVEKTSEPIEPVTDRTANEVSTKEDVKAMSLDELSSLFSQMKKRSGRNTSTSTRLNIDDDSSEVTYTASEVREYIPSTNTIELRQSVSKEDLCKYAFNMSGLQIPSSAIRLVDTNTEVSGITKPGQYWWYINTPEGKEIKTTLVVM